MPRTRIKICGITRAEDAQIAVHAGADALGFVFYPPSPRYVAPARAASIVAAVPAFVCTVGLFVNHDVESVRQILAEVSLDLLQFHGDEPPSFCRQFGKPYIKAVRVKSDTNLVQYALDFHDAKALLLDAFVEGVPGGTGEAFDWNLLPRDFSKPIILAGGLTPENVEHAIRLTRPYAVDVSGGVELSKGIKSADKIAAFIKGVSNATV